MSFAFTQRKGGYIFFEEYQLAELYKKVIQLYQKKRKNEEVNAYFEKINILLVDTIDIIKEEIKIWIEIKKKIFTLTLFWGNLVEIIFPFGQNKREIIKIIKTALLLNLKVNNYLFWNENDNGKYLFFKEIIMQNILSPKAYIL